MISFVAIRKAIYTWAKNNLGVEAIWLDQSGPRVQKPYAGLKIITPLVAIGHDEIDVNDAGQVESRGVRELTVSVNVYGEGALDKMVSAHGRLELPSVQAKLRAAGLIYVSRTGVRDLTVPFETSFESRAQMDVRFRLSDALVDVETGSIEQVEITNDLTGETFLIPEED